MTKDQQEIRRKLRILDHAAASSDVSKTCRYFGIGRASFYRWRHALADRGEAGLANKRSVPHNHPNRTPEAITEKVLHLRREYYRAPICIVGSGQNMVVIPRVFYLRRSADRRELRPL